MCPWLHSVSFYSEVDVHIFGLIFVDIQSSFFGFSFHPYKHLLCFNSVAPYRFDVVCIRQDHSRALISKYFKFYVGFFDSYSQHYVKEQGRKPVAWPCFKPLVMGDVSRVCLPILTLALEFQTHILLLVKLMIFLGTPVLSSTSQTLSLTMLSYVGGNLRITDAHFCCILSFFPKVVVL